MNLNKRKTLLLAFVLIVMGLVLLFQNLNQSAIDDTLSKKKSEDYYKLEYALNNGCLPTWLVDTKYSTYEGKDVIIGYGKDRKDKYVFYSDLTAKNIDTGKTAVWKCDGIENLDISGNPLPTDEEMHEGALYNDNGDIVANEYELEESNRRIRREKKQERQNIQRQTDNSYNEYDTQKKLEKERQNEPCKSCSKVFKFRIWKNRGWAEVDEQKTGWVKCKDCSGYGLNWDYNSWERRPESSRCNVSICVNGWVECHNWRKH